MQLFYHQHLLCALTPMDEKYAIESNYIKGQIEDILERVSVRNSTLLIKASEITRDHNVCSEKPWIRAYASAELEHAYASLSSNI